MTVSSFHFSLNQAFYKGNVIEKNKMTSKKIIKIGTRGSTLALYQANLVKSCLEKKCHINDLPSSFEIIEITTTGDKVLDRRLSDIGGKALFTKEIDLALLDGRIDIAVHSMKDCETWLPSGFKLAAILEREDPRDALISQNNAFLNDLPQGAIFGTCSLRRTSQMLHLRPDFKTTLFRGNIQTRLQKIKDGEADATMLAIAGLNRLNLMDKAYQIFSPQEMTPCAGQGAIGIVCLKEKKELINLLHILNHDESFKRVSLERSFLEHIDGHCGTPIGALATLDNNHINFTACVATLEGRHLWRETLLLNQKTALPEIIRLGKEMKQWLHKHNL